MFFLLLDGDRETELGHGIALGDLGDLLLHDHDDRLDVLALGVDDSLDLVGLSLDLVDAAIIVGRGSLGVLRRWRSE